MKLKISKIDAARRQLDMAIRLWFSDSDPVVIHSLACAAFQIIQDLNDNKGDKSLTLLEITRRLVMPEHVKDVIAAIREPMNFFKHANRDPHGILEFEPEISVTFIGISIIGLGNLGEQQTDAQTIFLHWARLHKPHWFKEGNELLNQLGQDRLQLLKGTAKAKFFELSLASLAKNKSLKNS